MSKNSRKQEPAAAPNDTSTQAAETVTEGDSDDAEFDVGAELQAAPVVVEPSGPVLCAVLSNLHHDGGEYRPGNMVKLQPHQADELSKLGIVTRALPGFRPLSYFLLDDLRRAVGRDITVRFLDDNGDGEEDEEAIQYLQDAVDSQIEVRLGRLYSVDTLRTNTPPTVRAIGTDLALAMMGERRPEFDGADGKSQFWMRGKRATDLLISIQKGDARLDIDANPAKPGNVFGGVRVPSSAETKPLVTDGFIRNGSGDF